MAGSMQGKVVAIGPSGNLITDLPAERFADVPRDERLSVVCDEHETRGLFGVEHGEPACTFLAMVPASGPLELTLVGEDASRFLGIRIGPR